LGQLYRSYLNAKSMSAPSLTRSPLWAKLGDNEDQGEGRLRELDSIEEWRKHREFLQRHIRELPESDRKRRLVGDPRLHDINHIHHIQRLKTEDIQRHRDRARKIQDVMAECSKSRYQFMRMQKQLVADLPTSKTSMPTAAEDSPPSMPSAAEDAPLSGNT
jgi:hypothetical protein